MAGSVADTEKAFLDELTRHRLLIPSGVPGVFGRGAAFEDVLEGLDRFITRSAAGDGAEVLRFPPVINRRDFERSQFLKSFPQLAGSVFSFEGTHDEHMELLALAEAGADWSAMQKMTERGAGPGGLLSPLSHGRGDPPGGGRLFDVLSYCFRHEPSSDPARMQMFRMREFVRMGEPDAVVPWRDTWLERGRGMLQSLGLDVQADVASDPFFGRGGKLLAIEPARPAAQVRAAVAHLLAWPVPPP